MSNPDQRSKITVEDLLRLKRSEQPAAEFWTNFERELRQKQLSALLEKRPWWQVLSSSLARRAYIPAGATALVALTLVSVKYHSPVRVASEGIISAAPEITVAAAGEAMADGNLHSVPGDSISSGDRNDQLISRSEKPSGVAAVAADSMSVADLMPVLLTPRVVESPSARSIAANLARLEQSEPDLVRAASGSRLSSTARVQTALASRDELLSVPVGSSRRNRLLAQYDERNFGPEPTAPDIVRERLARQLGDAELNDRLTRLGVRGDRVSLKF